MTWKKFFKPVNSVLPVNQRTQDNTSAYTSTSKYSNWLPEVYSGPPDRLQRYNVYDQMSFDHEISAALDTIADFGTELDEITQQPLVVKYNDEPTSSEIQIIEKSLSQWVRLNKLSKRLWGMFRSTLQYGDQFFLRDPETFKLYWIDPSKVEKVIVNESDGKKIESYFIKDIDLNIKSMVATNQLNRASAAAFGSNSIIFSPPLQGNLGFVSSGFGAAGSLNFKDNSSTPVDAEHIVQLSLTDGMNSSWPFGLSILEQIYKVYKQKELLEDAILIYRVHRAPERRVFFIDVGTMPPNKAQQYLERVRYEVQQKRIPSRTGGGSNIVDSTYNPMCLDMNTRIPLLDGRVLTISQLTEEYQQGKENWVYSTDPVTGKVAPGNITWAGVTRKDAQVIKLTLNNGRELVLTPDHKIPVLGKGFVEAKDLTVNDPLISFETKQTSLPNNPAETYQQIYDHQSASWKYSHRVVAEFFKSMGKHQEFVFSDDCMLDDKDTVNHKDYNKTNNNPGNLQWMNRHDHTLYHSFTSKDLWQSIPDRDKLIAIRRIKLALEKYRNENPDWKKQYQDRNTSAIQSVKDENLQSKFSLRTFINGIVFSLSSVCNDSIQILKEKIASVLPNTQRCGSRLVFTRDIFSYVVNVARDCSADKLAVLQSINHDSKFIELVRSANPTLSKTEICALTVQDLEQLCYSFGFTGWQDFKKNALPYGCKIAKIEWLTQTQDVGTITVDGKEKWHNYHTFAVESGIFVKNSILEDYFFAVTSEGRGSKVEVLPGGENLGDIDDLKYFNNKMLRALGIPSSYLPSGPDDGSTAVTDGRVGTAFIQEYRFSKVVKRYQQQIVEPIDREFKLFLKNRGVTIDSSLFELEFTSPQSFSEYRQLELDSARINTFTALMDVPYISKRFVLKTYLAWTDAQMAENERMWKEERSRLTKSFNQPTMGGPGLPGGAGPAAGLSDIGITSSGIDNMSPETEETPPDTDIGGEAPDNVTSNEVDNFGG